MNATTTTPTTAAEAAEVATTPARDEDALVRAALRRLERDNR